MLSLASSFTGPVEIARFPAETMRGTGGNAPQAVFAYGASGDMGFLDVAANVEPSEGAAAPTEPNGPLDAYLYTDRSLYQPGETVFLSGLLRDANAMAVQGRALTLKCGGRMGSRWIAVRSLMREGAAKRLRPGYPASGFDRAMVGHRSS